MKIKYNYTGIYLHLEKFLFLNFVIQIISLV